MLRFRLSCAPETERCTECPNNPNKEEEEVLLPFCNHKSLQFGLCHHQVPTNYCRAFCHDQHSTKLFMNLIIGLFLRNTDETIQTITIHLDRILCINLCTLINTAPMRSYCAWSVYKTINQQLSSESCLLLWIKLWDENVMKIIVGLKWYNFMSNYEINQVKMYLIILTFKLRVMGFFSHNYN